MPSLYYCFLLSFLTTSPVLLFFVKGDLDHHRSNCSCDADFDLLNVHWSHRLHEIFDDSSRIVGGSFSLIERS